MNHKTPENTSKELRGITYGRPRRWRENETDPFPKSDIWLFGKAYDFCQLFNMSVSISASLPVPPFISLLSTVSPVISLISFVFPWLISFIPIFIHITSQFSRWSVSVPVVINIFSFRNLSFILRIGRAWPLFFKISTTWVTTSWWIYLTFRIGTLLLFVFSWLFFPSFMRFIIFGIWVWGLLSPVSIVLWLSTEGQTQFVSTALCRSDDTFIGGHVSGHKI